jgi:hypothetical protein
VAWGIARTVLPDTGLPFQTDHESALQVTMVSGSLASVSNLEMLNGANLAALIRADGNAELIQFQDVALSLGVYTLTTLLRGRRGTEVFTGATPWATCSSCSTVMVDPAALGLDRLGTRFITARSAAAVSWDARTEQLTLAGNDLKPYAPAQLEATGNWGSNVTLSWQRRTRVGGELIDGTGEVPLAEDSERYDLEILDGPGGAVLRTETGITTTSFTYTSSMQSADFGGAQTELSFVVYQISAQVGRGFRASDRGDRRRATISSSPQVAAAQNQKESRSTTRPVSSMPG